MWMAFVYLVAGYVRLYGVNKIVQQYALPISLGILALLSIGIAGVDIMRHTDFHRLIGQYQLHGFASDSPVFFLSLAIFVWTVTRKSVATTFYLSLFSRIAPYILAVYLIHMNKYFYVYVWNVVMPESYSMPVAIHALLWCTLITVICIVIDYARSKVFKMIGIDYVINTISASIKCKSIKTKYQQT